MTLQQLKYLITVASVGTISGAAKLLYVAQPSLTAAIKELEEEFGITIFNRTNKGVVTTKEGEEFLGYARQVIEQSNLLKEKYNGNKKDKHQFCISTQHYSFAVEAFVELIKKCGFDEYDFHLRETQTYELIEDVAKLRSEIGILYLNRFNETVIRKTFGAYDLKFYSLLVAKPHVFISRKSPLAKKDFITIDELAAYPCLSFEQGEHNSFYFSEEIQSILERKKNIRVRDRATLFDLLIGLNGYTISSGIISKSLNSKDIVAVPLKIDDYMEIGYILHEKMNVSELGNIYIDALKKSVKRAKML